MSRGWLFGVGALVAALAIWFLAQGDRASEKPAVPVSDASGNEVTDGGPALAIEREPTAVDVPPPAPLEATPTEPDEQEGHVVIVGRVVDARRRPVAGAEVTVHASGVGTPLRDDTPTTRTAKDGRFALGGIGLDPMATFLIVHARNGSDSGYVGRSLYQQGTTRVDVGTIAIAPASDIAVRVVDTSGTSLAGAPVYLAASHWASQAVIERARTGDDGTCVLRNVAPGLYRVLARPEGRARGVQPLRAPSLVKGPVQIIVGPTRQLTALVTDKSTGVPIPGASVTVEDLVESNFGQRLVPYWPPLPDLTTGADGRVAVPWIGAEDKVQLLATAKGYPGDSGSRMIMSHPLDKQEVELKLSPLRSLTFPLSKTEGAPQPADGTQLTLEHQSGAMPRQLPTRAWVQDGKIHAENCVTGFFHAIAVAPDDSWAPLFVGRGADAGAETWFRKQRHVRVTVQTATGDPAPGWQVSLRGGGNNLVGGPVLSDAQGVALVPVRTRRPRLTAFVSRSSEPHSGRSVGTVNLKDVDAPTLTVQLAAEQPVELTVTLGGTPGLPADYSIRFGNTPVKIVEEDDDTGVVRFSLAQPKGQQWSVTVLAAGYTAPAVKLPPPVTGEVTRVQVDLKRTGLLLARVRPPTDGTMSLRVQAVKALSGPPGFGATGGMQTIGQEGEWLIVLFPGLPPGRFRIVDGATRKLSEPVDVPAGDDPARVEFDLRAAGYTSGTVEVPSGYEVHKVRVRMEAEGLVKPSAYMLASQQGAHVRKDGTFRIRVPGDRKVRLVGWHPLLVPAKEGSPEVTKPVQGVRLKLVPGASARFRLDPPFDPSKRVSGAPSVRVFLFDGPAQGKPALTPTPVNKDGEYTIAGFQPGTYTVVVNARFHAPTILSDVDLTDADKDLGVVSLQAGATLRVKILTPDDQTSPRISASAWTEAPFPYSRYINSKGEGDVLIRGLGKGTFKVHAGASIGAGRALHEDVVCDGENEVVVTLDLR